MSTEENKAIIQRWLEAWNTGELGALVEIIAPDYVHHAHGNSIRTESGPEWYEQAVAGHRASFPDHYGSLQAMIAEGDMVVTRWTVTGSHRGQWTAPTGAVIPPTGKTITYTGITIARLAGGKIVEEWWEQDSVSLLQQLGVIPEAAQAAT